MVDEVVIIISGKTRVGKNPGFLKKKTTHWVFLFFFWVILGFIGLFLVLLFFFIIHIYTIGAKEDDAWRGSVDIPGGV